MKRNKAKKKRKKKNRSLATKKVVNPFRKRKRKKSESSKKSFMTTKQLDEYNKVKDQEEKAAAVRVTNYQNAKEDERQKRIKNKGAIESSGIYPPGELNTELSTNESGFDVQHQS